MSVMRCINSNIIAKSKFPDRFACFGVPASQSVDIVRRLVLLGKESLYTITFRTLIPAALGRGWTLTYALVVVHASSMALQMCSAWTLQLPVLVPQIKWFCLNERAFDTLSLANETIALFTAFSHTFVCLLRSDGPGNNYIVIYELWTGWRALAPN